MKFSIIISLHDDDRIERCLRAIARQEFKDFEIIVVENGSANAGDVCRSFDVIYIHETEKSMPKARDLGLKAAKGRYVAFTDADCVPDEMWLSELDKCFESDLDVIGGRIKRYNPMTYTEKYCTNVGGGQSKLQTYLPVLDYPYIVFANAAFRREKLTQIGPFDYRLKSGNDVDICWRLHKKGAKFGLCVSAIVYHENRKTISGYFKAHFRYAKYQVLLFDKYKDDITGYNRRNGRFFIINTYPFSLVARALGQIICGKGIIRQWYDLVQGCAILCGILVGCILEMKSPIYR